MKKKFFSHWVWMVLLVVLIGCQQEKPAIVEKEPQQAPLFIDADQGKTWNVFGLKIIGKIMSEDTDGAYSVIVSHTPPAGGPPPHIHENEEEMFYVLEGTFEFIYGDKKVIANKGAMVVLPKNLPHSFKNVGNSTGITMNTMTPGGLEKFFDEIAAISKDGPPDPKQISEIALKYKMRFLSTDGNN